MTECTSRYECDNDAPQTWGQDNADFNFVYTYTGSYRDLLYAYAEPSPILVMYSDGWYDGQAATSQPARTLLRNLVWWALSTGSRGYIYGRQNLFAWDTGATHLSDNVFDATDFKVIMDTYTSMTGWHQLMPDSSSALVTSARGTLLPYETPGSNIWYTGLSGGAGGAVVNKYITASITPDGTLALIYIPDATVATSVNGSLMLPGYSAHWIDPVNGARLSRRSRARTRMRARTLSAARIGADPDHTPLCGVDRPLTGWDTDGRL